MCGKPLVVFAKIKLRKIYSLKVLSFDHLALMETYKSQNIYVHSWKLAAIIFGKQ